MNWNDDEDDGTIEGAVRFEQYSLWSDLAIAVRTGINTEWSMQCEGLAARICSLAKYVGPVPFEYIQIPLLRSGVYQRIYDQAGITYPPIDWERIGRAEARIQGRAS